MSWSSSDPPLPPPWPPPPRLVLEAIVVLLTAVLAFSVFKPLGTHADRLALVAFQDGDYGVSIRQGCQLDRGVLRLQWTNFGDVLRPYRTDGNDAFCRVPLAAKKRSSDIVADADLVVLDFEVVAMFQSLGDRSVTVHLNRSLLGLLLLAIATPAVHRRLQRRRFTARLAANQCPHCGFDLRATPKQCPECGRG